MEKKLVGEILRFVVAGAVAIGIHYGVYYLLNIWWNYNVSYTIGYVTSIIVHYFITALYTFKADSGVKNGTGYVVAQVANYFLQMLLLNVFIRCCGMPKEVAFIPTYCIAGPLNFVCLKLIFKFLH